MLGETGLCMLIPYETQAMHILQVGCSTWLEAIILKKDTSELKKELSKCENFILLHAGAQIKIK